MGQKVRPIGLRLKINRNWDSQWYVNKKNYSRQLHEDLLIRNLVKKLLGAAGISRVIIKRPTLHEIHIEISAARPGIVIGKKGADIDKAKKEIAKITSSEIKIDIVEVRKPEIDATLIAQNIAQQLEKRVAFRRAMKRAIQTAMRNGAKGIRVNCSGRLGGAEIARMEWYREGRVPLHTLRADIDYGTARANTTYGVIGLKVWVYKGDASMYQQQAANYK